MNEEFNRIVRDVARRHPIEVLYLEDDDQTIEIALDLYRNAPVNLHPARSASEADKVLSSVAIDSAIIDVRLGEGQMTGEEWLAAHLDELKRRGVRIYVLTGRIGDIRDRQTIEAASTLVAKGASDESDLVWKALPEAAHQRAREAIGQVAVGETTRQEARAGERLRKRMAALFEQWVLKLPDQDSPLFLHGARSLAPADVLREVREESTLGDFYLEAFVADLESFV